MIKGASVTETYTCVTVGSGYLPAASLLFLPHVDHKTHDKRHTTHLYLALRRELASLFRFRPIGSRVTCSSVI